MSRLTRLATLGTLGSKVGARWVQDRVSSALGRGEGVRDALRGQAASEIADTLSTLKGAAMKAGQQLALAARHLDLPEEVRAPLARLHRDAEPVPFDRIRAVVEAELEGTLAEKFAAFDPTPLGTASLAQAHAAVLPTGERVVVKVLHDGVLDGLEADLLALRGVLASGRLFGRGKDEIRAVYEEVEARLREELDYLQEAANIAEFRRVFAGDPRVRVPVVYGAYSTERVLCMDHLPGDPLDTFAATAPPEVREATGLVLAELFLDMAFRHRLLHADPHPGNYLFEADGRVGMIDFGCVKRFDAFFMATYARTALAAMDGDRAACLQACRDIGAWTGEDPGAADVIWDFCQAIVRPFQSGRLRLGGPRDTVVEQATAAARRMWRYPEIQGAADMLFLHRTLGGLYTLGRSLGIEADFEPMLRRAFEDAINAARAPGDYRRIQSSSTSPGIRAK